MILAQRNKNGEGFAKINSAFTYYSLFSASNSNE